MDLSLAETLGVVLPGLATGLGGLVLLALRRNPSDRMLDGLTGLTAGVVLAAAVFSLLVPALERGRFSTVVLGFVAGVAFLAALDALVPHVHARFAERGHQDPSAPSRSSAPCSAGGADDPQRPRGDGRRPRLSVERPAAVLAALLVGVIGGLLTGGLAFAAGFVVMLLLDNAVG